MYGLHASNGGLLLIHDDSHERSQDADMNRKKKSRIELSQQTFPPEITADMMEHMPPHIHQIINHNNSTRLSSSIILSNNYTGTKLVQHNGNILHYVQSWKLKVPGTIRVMYVLDTALGPYCLCQ
jgi:REP element-mobilizing transposase RayT